MGVKELSHGALGRSSRTEQASQEFTFFRFVLAAGIGRQDPSSPPVRPDVYGPGITMDQYAKPVEPVAPSGE